MPRINDTLQPDLSFPESSRFLQQIIDAISFDPAPPAVGDPECKPHRELDQFYRDYYVPLDKEREEQRIIISSYEQRIIDFCKNPRSGTRIFVLYGHTGVGKSTLLRRIIWYLCPKLPDLENALLIYLRTDPSWDEDEDSNMPYQEFIEIICAKTYKFVLKKMQKKRFMRSMLQKMHQDNRRFHGDFPKEIIDQAVQQGADMWLYALPDRMNFQIELLTLMIRERQISVILFVDDVDRRTSRVHTNVFSALDRLSSIGIAAVVSMRTSTFQQASTNLLDYRDQKMELRLTQDLIYEILHRRVEHVKRLWGSIPLHPEIPFRLRDHEKVSGLEVLDSFCNIVLPPTNLKALIALSNTNLKSIFWKLDLMAKSEAFSDRFIVHQLLDRAVIPEEFQSPRLWVFYHLLLGNYAGTYKQDPETCKAGLINVFDTATLEVANPWRHFIIINLLLYLYKCTGEARGNDEYVPVTKLREDVKDTFGNLVSTALLIDAIWVLVTSELVFMRSCRRYGNREQLVNLVFGDAMQISTAGRFYVNNLIHKVEYLYFVKDDINWDRLPERLKPASRDYDRPAKFSDVLQALEFLLEQEYNGFGKLKEYWLGEPEYENVLRRYRDLFSPYSLADGTISICEVLWGSYERFMQRVLGASFSSSPVSKLIRRLETLRNANDNLRQTYL